MKVNRGIISPFGSSLIFSIIPSGGIFDPYDSVQVWWEVSNGGVETDHDHQDIYYKVKKEGETKEKFTREVTYRGIHLLRCRVKNIKKHFDATKIFIVNGYKE